jgi:hypothetical protein
MLYITASMHAFNTKGQLMKPFLQNEQKDDRSFVTTGERMISI